MVYEEDQLEAKIAEVLARREKPVPGTNVGKVNLIRTIKTFIEDHNY